MTKFITIWFLSSELNSSLVADDVEKLMFSIPVKYNKIKIGQPNKKLKSPINVSNIQRWLLLLFFVVSFQTILKKELINNLIINKYFNLPV